MKNLRTVDLNLLTCLDALLAERNVTKAAIRLGLSQPATSNALRRLREVFGDEILVRTATGMKPTPRGLELHDEVVPILRRLEHVFQGDLPFEPASSTKQFRMRMSDVLEYLLMPIVLPDFLARAPAANLNVVHLSPEETVDALEGDRLELAVSSGLNHPKSIRSRHLFKDRMVCVMRQGHRTSEGELTVDRLLAERHIRVSISPTDKRFVDNTLASMSRSRDIAFQTQHWTLLPALLRDTELLSIMPQSLASSLGGGLVVRPLPFPSATFNWTLYWHRRYASDPGVQWLIERVVAAGGRYGEPARATETVKARRA